ncbi:MAG TPA: ABC transporter permease [Acidimicrobiales bacterium]|nr:ABC transporter permease [Acidimicrobiales bacterium]
MMAASNPLVQWSWVTGNWGDTIRPYLLQHAELAAIAVGIGFVISLPSAVAVWWFRRARGPVFGFAGLLYTIPSIALFGIIEPFTGYFSITTGEVALVSYTLLILIRNIVVGLDAVPEEVREAARAVGYSPLAELVRVDLPLALPSIFAGLRVATVTVVGLVNVTAFIGLGGLGQLILTGFQRSFNTPIVVALVLSIAMAGLGDLVFVVAERAVVRWARVVETT